MSKIGAPLSRQPIAILVRSPDQLALAPLEEPRLLLSLRNPFGAVPAWTVRNQPSTARCAAESPPIRLPRSMSTAPRTPTARPTTHHDGASLIASDPANQPHLGMGGTSEAWGSSGSGIDAPTPPSIALPESSPSGDRAPIVHLARDRAMAVRSPRSPGHHRLPGSGSVRTPWPEPSSPRPSRESFAGTPSGPRGLPIGGTLDLTRIACRQAAASWLLLTPLSGVFEA